MTGVQAALHHDHKYTVKERTDRITPGPKEAIDE